MARALGVNAVLIGSVSEFGYQHGLKEEPTVGVNVRLVSGISGQVLWASSASDTGRGLFFRDSVNETAQRVVIKMVDALSKRVPRKIQRRKRARNSYSSN
jgi:polysaccharide biosynthesis protein PelC